ncbi:hypothetical protein BS17DRAFT_85056 [Gyrodon lividus]|nr:hypothetical protein BS17DRAFT_85056 [Gyrodon lividus]
MSLLDTRDTVNHLYTARLAHCSATCLRVHYKCVLETSGWHTTLIVVTCVYSVLLTNLKFHRCRLSCGLNVITGHHVIAIIHHVVPRSRSLGFRTAVIDSACDHSLAMCGVVRILEAHARYGRRYTYAATHEAQHRVYVMIASFISCLLRANPELAIPV